MKEKKIKDGYQRLKLEFDKLHVEFITQSLESESARSIDFSKYLEIFKNKEKVSGRVTTNFNVYLFSVNPIAVKNSSVRLISKYLSLISLTL